MRIAGRIYLIFALFFFPFLGKGAGSGKYHNHSSLGNPLIANAGSPQTFCHCDTATLGGTIANPTASGGTPPYTYHWAPRTGMGADSTTANPKAWVCTTTTFTLTLVDNLGKVATSTVVITIDNIAAVNAGPPVSFCPYIGKATLGAPTNPPSYNYQWAPSTGLNFSNIGNPTVSASALTPPGITYTLIASDGTCADTTTVTVTLLPPAPISTVSPLTIHRGQSAQLSASGGTSYLWRPGGTLSDSLISNPIASPLKTTTYYVEDQDGSGCIGFDSVVVNVLQDSILIFYNTFTPNHDGINDTWYIGNIDLFPNNEVQVFNRNGSQVFHAFGYMNTWDGSMFGTDLPDATYYYVVSTGTGVNYQGSVTIIRKPQ